MPKSEYPSRKEDSPTVIVSREKELTELGFVRLGFTDLYAGGAFIIKARDQETPELFAHDLSRINLSEIVGINVGRKTFFISQYRQRETDALQILYESQGKLKVYRKEPGSHTDGHPDSVETKGKRIITNDRVGGHASFIDVPLAEQFAFAGFEEIDYGIFIKTLDLGHDKPKFETYIFVLGEDGKVNLMAKSIEAETSSLLRQGSRFSALSTDIDKERPYRNLSSLTISDGIIEFRIMSSISGCLGGVVEGSRRLVVEIPPTQLGLVGIPGLPWKEVKTDVFVEGLTNTDEAIRNLKSLNGIPLETIEQALKDAESPYDNDKPWLDSRESLIDNLVRHNQSREALGLSHQQFAAALQDLLNAANLHRFDEFIYYGVPFKFEKIDWSSLFEQKLYPTPFGVGRMLEGSLMVTNLLTQRELSYDYVVPELINRYGYYGNLSPEEIVAVLDFFATV